MPLLFEFYIIIFLLFTLSNLGYWVYMHNNIRIVLYDFFSGLYLVLMMIAYWKPEVKVNMSILNVFAFLFIIGLEFYITTWGDLEKMGIKVPEGTSKNEIETAKCLSIIVAAPAYITAALLSWELIKFPFI